MIPTFVAVVTLFHLLEGFLHGQEGLWQIRTHRVLAVTTAASTVVHFIVAGFGFYIFFTM